MKKAQEIDKNKGRAKRRNSLIASNFTLLELMIVIAIIAILAALLLPALNRARQTSYRVDCLSKLKQIGLANLGYAGDNQEYCQPSSYTVGGKYALWFVHLIDDKTLAPSSFFCKANNVNNVPAISNLPANGYTSKPELAGYPRTFQINSMLSGFFYEAGHALRLPYKLNQVKYPTRAVHAFCCLNLTGSSNARLGYMQSAYISRYVNKGDLYAVPLHGKSYNFVFADGHAATVDAMDYNNNYVADVVQNQ